MCGEACELFFMYICTICTILYFIYHFLHSLTEKNLNRLIVLYYLNQEQECLLIGSSRGSLCVHVCVCALLTVPQTTVINKVYLCDLWGYRLAEGSNLIDNSMTLLVVYSDVRKPYPSHYISLDRP